MSSVHLSAVSAMKKVPNSSVTASASTPTPSKFTGNVPAVVFGLAAGWLWLLWFVLALLGLRCDANDGWRPH